MLCLNFRVNTNQKSIIDTHTKKRKESKITLKVVIKLQKKRTREEERNKKTYKITPKQLTKWQ